MKPSLYTDVKPSKSHIDSWYFFLKQIILKFVVFVTKAQHIIKVYAHISKKHI